MAENSLENDEIFNEKDELRRGEDFKNEAEDEEEIQYLNCHPITCADIKHQGRIFLKAFQYLVKPTWQLALSEVFLAAVPLITFCFVANNGYDQLIGTGFGISLCGMFGLGFCYASSSASYELALEKEHRKEAVVTIQRGLFITLAVICLPMWAVWLNAGPLFRALKQDPMHSSLGDEYCFMFLPGLPIFVIVLFLQKFMKIARENATLPIALCNFLGAIFSIALNAAFVVGLKMGVRGGALAAVLTYLCLALSLILCILWNPKYRQAWQGWSWDLLLNWGQFAVRLIPYLLWVIMEWWTLDIGIYVIGSLNFFNRRLGTQIVVYLVIRWLAVVADRFASEASDQIEEAVRANYFHRAAFIVKCSIFIMWLSSILCGILLIMLPKYVPPSYTNQRTFGLSTRAMVMLIAPIPFLKGTQALGLKVIGKVKSKYLNLVFVMIGFCAFALPVGLFLVYVGLWGITGYWTGYTLGFLFQGLMFLAALKDCMIEWLNNENEKTNAPPTPSGIVQSDDDVVDGYFHMKSLMLGEPRIHARFTSVESERDEADGPGRPVTITLIYRGFVIFLSIAILGVGVATRASLSGFSHHIENTS